MKTSSEQRLAQLTLFARAIGYRIREDFLDGCGGGLSQIDGARWILLDAMKSTDEKTRILLQVLQNDTRAQDELIRPQLDKFERSAAPRKAA